MQTAGPRVAPNNSHQPPRVAAPKAKLLDQVRHAIRARHYSKRTERTYVEWIKRFILFHGKRHPLEMGEPELRPFSIFDLQLVICH